MVVVANHEGGPSSFAVSYDIKLHELGSAGMHSRGWCFSVQIDLQGMIPNPLTWLMISSRALKDDA